MKEDSLEGIPEEQLWVRYRKTRDPAIRSRLILQYSPLVKYVAGRLSVGMPNDVEFDDLVGFGVFGLFDAIEKFDPEKHVKFKTYAVTRIRGAIFDELRSIDWVPRSVRQKTREVDEAIQAFESKVGRPATDQEIAKQMNLTLREYSQVIQKIRGSSLLSLSDLWGSSDDKEGVSLGDNIESPASLRPEVIVQKKGMKRVIVEAIKELPEREKKVLVLYYYEELTLKEIGKVLAVTESRISQIHTKAIARLRAKLTNSKKGIF